MNNNIMQIPPLPPISKGKEWYIRLKTSSAAHTKVPLEAVISYPIPGEDSSLKTFAYLVKKDDSTTKAVLFAIYTGNVSNLKDADVVTKEESELFSGMEKEVTLSDSKPYSSEKEDALLSLLPEVVDAYGNKGNKEVAKKYYILLKEITNDALHEYYEALNPKFFSWVNEA